jgi:hypothetical protein
MIIYRIQLQRRQGVGVTVHGLYREGDPGTNFLVACAPQNRCPLLYSKAETGFLQFKEPGLYKIDLKHHFYNTVRTAIRMEVTSIVEI